MIEDLCEYKQKAEMSKEKATYFDPFSSIRVHDLNTVNSQPVAKHDVLDVKDIM